jgi:hypothetical protein
MDMHLTYKAPDELVPGDVIANVGRVERTRREGAFLLVEVSMTEWSLVTGRGRLITRDLVLHAFEALVVRQ